MRKDFETRLAVGEVTVTKRDVEMLRAIDCRGSMSAAAESLGRSYPHLQRRVVELEEEIGELTERRRGGADGGGTVLTPTAQELVRRFSRLRAELEGVASVTESVLVGRVEDRDGEIGTVATDVGRIAAVVPPDATDVEVAVRSDAVVLQQPDSDGETSLRNELSGVVTTIDSGDSVAEVTVELDGGPELAALVTAESREMLSLDVGTRTFASFKATAARGIGVE